MRISRARRRARQSESYPDKARTGDGSGLVLCVPKQSPQNTVHLYSIHVSHFHAQALQPTTPRTHAASRATQRTGGARLGRVGVGLLGAGVEFGCRLAHASHAVIADT